MTQKLQKKAPRAARLSLAIAAAGALLIAGSQARAQSITGLSIVKNAGNSADENSTSNPLFQRASAVSTVSSTSTSFTTRYAFVTAADYDGFQIIGATKTESLTSDYQISFTVTAPGAFKLNVSTSLVGAFTRVADGGGGNASADIGPVNGAPTGVTLASGSLGIADVGSLGNAGGTTNTGFSGSGTAVLTGVSNGSPVSVTLRFTNFNPTCSSVVSFLGTNAPECAVRGGVSTGTISAGQYPGQGSRTQANDGHFVTVSLESLCGNGTVDAGFEDCDLPGQNGNSDVCCTSACKFKTGGTQCRAASDVCDAAESCTGSAATCPADGVKSTSTLCRAQSGVCDVADFCDGVNKACGADNVASTTTLCRPSVDVCDVDDFCDGVSKDCGADNVASTTTLCRGATDVCDVDDFCDGVNTACGADNVAAPTTLCRAADGICDVDDFCDGVNKACGADNVAPTTTVCRGVGGVCDVAESCDGVNKTCPTDLTAPSSTVCRPSGGVCDAVETCTGAPGVAGYNCPADAVQPTTTVCRASAGVCDVDDHCPGNGADCTADVREPTTTVCRPAFAHGIDPAVCDIAENCTGDVDCPPDVVKPDSDGDGVCDIADNCPSTPDPTLADSDGDGVGDVCDPCTNIDNVDLLKVKVNATKIDTPASDDGFKFAGTVTIPTPPSIDPVARGLRFRFEDPDGNGVWDETIPAGAYNAALRVGWFAKPHNWKYKNVGLIVPLINGIGGITLTENAKVPGQLKFSIKAKKGFYPIFPEDIPLKVSLILDPPFAETGQCGEVVLSSANCTFSKTGAKLACK